MSTAYPAATTPQQRRARRIDTAVEKVKKGKRYSRQTIAEEFNLSVASGTFYFRDLLEALKRKGIKYRLVEDSKPGNNGPSVQFVEAEQ